MAGTRPIGSLLAARGPARSGSWRRGCCRAKGRSTLCGAPLSKRGRCAIAWGTSAGRRKRPSSPSANACQACPPSPEDFSPLPSSARELPSVSSSRVWKSGRRGLARLARGPPLSPADSGGDLCHDATRPATPRVASRPLGPSLTLAAGGGLALPRPRMGKGSGNEFRAGGKSHFVPGPREETCREALCPAPDACPPANTLTTPRHGLGGYGNRK